MNKSHIKKKGATWMRIISLFILGIIIQSCDYLNNVRLLTGGDLGRHNFVQTIPFEYRKGLIVVRARVNDDTTKHEFILDTGAFNSKIEHGLADYLELPTIARKYNSTAQGNMRTIDVSRIDSITLGKTNFNRIGAGKLNYDPKSASPCIAKDGIIGANLMKLVHWKVDFARQQLHFSDQPFQQDPDLPQYPLPFDHPLLSGTPEVTLKIEDRTIGPVLFDLGYNGGLIVPDYLVSSFPTDSEQIILDRSTTGIYGSNVDTLTIKQLEVDLGGYVTSMPVTFSSIGKALLGNEVLEHFTVLIDYRRDEITLQPRNQVRIDPSTTFIPGVLNDSLWVVDRTVPDLDVQLGDTLRTINGMQPSDLFDSHCEYVMNIRAWLETETLTLRRLDGSEVIIGQP